VIQELGIPLAHPCWVQRKKRWHIHSVQTHPCVGLCFWIYRPGPLTFVLEIYFLVTLRHAEPDRISGTLRRGSRLFTWRHHTRWMKCGGSRALWLQSELHSPHSLCRVAAGYHSWCPKYQNKTKPNASQGVLHFTACCFTGELISSSLQLQKLHLCSIVTTFFLLKVHFIIFFLSQMWIPNQNIVLLYQFSIFFTRDSCLIL